MDTSWVLNSLSHNGNSMSSSFYFHTVFWICPCHAVPFKSLLSINLMYFNSLIMSRLRLLSSIRYFCQKISSWNLHWLLKSQWVLFYALVCYSRPYIMGFKDHLLISGLPSPYSIRQPIWTALCFLGWPHVCLLHSCVLGQICFSFIRKIFSYFKFQLKFHLFHKWEELSLSLGSI